MSREIQQAIREACPGVIINHTTGTSGPNYSGALDCVRETKPEMAACNAGSLNYLKVKADNTWAWPPMMFDNAVEKVQDYLDVMKAAGTIPEFECFDVGIVRCVGMYRQTGMYSGPLEYNFVMGVASGMPADPELLPILLKLKTAGSALAGHRDRPRRNLAAAPALRRSRRASAQRAGRHVLSGRRRQGDIERPVGREPRRLRPPRRPRDRQPGRGAADFRDQALSRHSGARKRSGSMPCAIWSDEITGVMDSGPALRASRNDEEEEAYMTDLAATGGVPGPGRIGRVAIGDLLKRAARRFPDRIALTDGARQVTFTEMERDANRFANYLVARGLKPGEKISTICNNTVEFVKALFGIHRAGLVWVPVNTMLGPADMDYILDHAEVRFALIDDNLHGQPIAARRCKSAAST